MMLAYFDDSGKFAESDYILLAGYLSDDKSWEEFTREWRGLLIQHEIPYVHMRDLVPLQGPYKKLAWDKDHRDDVIRQFIAVIRRNVFMGFGVAVDAKYLRKMGNDAQKVLKRPELFCFSRLMRHLTNTLSTIPWNEPVPLIFDDCEEFSVKIYRLWSQLRRQDQNIMSRFSAISFADDHIFHPLQAADILASETLKFLRNQASGRNIRDEIKLLMKDFANPSWGIDYVSELWDGPELERAYQQTKNPPVHS
jgi:hypothetical protein